MNVDEEKIYSHIRLYRVYENGDLKLLGERVLEDTSMEERVVKSILEDTNTPNRGAFIIMRGYYAEYFRNGIKFSATGLEIYDEIYLMDFMEKLVEEWKDFAGASTKQITLAGVFANENGMFTGHIPYFHPLIEAMAKHFRTTPSGVWKLIVDDLRNIADIIERDIVEDEK